MDDESNTAGLQRTIKVNDLVSGMGSVHDTEGECGRFVASSTVHEIFLCRVSIQASGISSQVEARDDPEADSPSAAVRCRWGAYSFLLVHSPSTNLDICSFSLFQWRSRCRYSPTYLFKRSWFAASSVSDGKPCRTTSPSGRPFAKHEDGRGGTRLDHILSTPLYHHATLSGTTQTTKGWEIQTKRMVLAAQMVSKPQKQS